MAAAAEENKPSFSMLLFTTVPDGKPMEFHMNPCPQKRILQTLVEVGKLI